MINITVCLLFYLRWGCWILFTYSKIYLNIKVPYINLTVKVTKGRKWQKVFRRYYKVEIERVIIIRKITLFLKKGLEIAAGSILIVRYIVYAS